MKRCDPMAWAQCPDRMNCEFGAVLLPGGECEAFNEHVLAKATPQRWVYDFVPCFSDASLAAVLHEINEHGYTLASVTQAGEKYTIFFRRPA